MKVTNNPESWSDKHWPKRAYESGMIIFLGEIKHRVSYIEQPDNKYDLYLCENADGDYVKVSSMLLSPTPWLTDVSRVYAVLVSREIRYKLTGEMERCSQKHELWCNSKSQLGATFTVADINTYIKAALAIQDSIESRLWDEMKVMLNHINQSEKEFNQKEEIAYLNNSISQYGLKCDALQVEESKVSHEGLNPYHQIVNKEVLKNVTEGYEQERQMNKEIYKIDAKTYHIKIKIDAIDEMVKRLGKNNERVIKQFIALLTEDPKVFKDNDKKYEF